MNLSFWHRRSQARLSQGRRTLVALMMGARTLVAAAAVLTIGAATAKEPKPAAEKLTHYKSAVYGFTIAVPSSWRLEPPLFAGQIVSFHSTRPQTGRISCAVDFRLLKLPGKAGRPSELRKRVSQLKASDFYVFVWESKFPQKRTESYSRLGGQFAKMVTFKFDFSTHGIKISKRYQTFRTHGAFIFYCETHSTNFDNPATRKIIETIWKSFRFTAPERTAMASLDHVATLTPKGFTRRYYAQHGFTLAFPASWLPGTNLAYTQAAFASKDYTLQCGATRYVRHLLSGKFDPRKLAEYAEMMKGRIQGGKDPLLRKLKFVSDADATLAGQAAKIFVTDLPNRGSQSAESMKRNHWIFTYRTSGYYHVSCVGPLSVAKRPAFQRLFKKIYNSFRFVRIRQNIERVEDPKNTPKNRKAP